MNTRLTLIALAAATVLGTAPAQAQRLMEKLDRGVIAVNQGPEGVFLSWRLMGTEARDLGFNVYRQTGTAAPVKLNPQPLTVGTNFTDKQANLAQATSYFVRTVTGGREGEPSKAFSFPANPPVRNYLSIPVQAPPRYTINDASTADLDGDGQYEIIAHLTGRAQDNANGGVTDEPILNAYKLDGKLMWSINLGKNIRDGAHYTQFMVFDLDSDGKAELVCKTADGTIDGVGKVIGDPKADHRQLPPANPPAANPPAANPMSWINVQPQVFGQQQPPAQAQPPVAPEQQPPAAEGRGGERGGRGEGGAGGQGGARRGGRRGGGGGGGGEGRFGYILKGPEFLTVFNGQTGAAMSTVDYYPKRHPVAGDNPTGEQMNEIWGDAYGNRIDRFLACVAYLDGVHPSVVMCRGYYTRTVLVAWDWRDGKLTQRWIFDSDVVEPGGRTWRGQGNHGISVADVDEDGKDEIIYGAMVVDDNGKGLYSTGGGHGDAQHTSDLDPSRPGLEIWSIHENPRNKPGVEMRNARTGEIYFQDAMSVDVGRGMASDIDPRHPGYEMWGGTNFLFNAKGENIGARPSSQNMAIWWDGDLLRELLDGVNIMKWDHENGQQVNMFDGRAQGLASNNGTKSNPCLSADILGDWREELIARTADNTEIRIYTTTIPTEYRLYTLMHDPQYRLAIAWQNVAYNQPPHPGFFLGAGMAAPPVPKIKLVGE